jgi:hypothetical protein
MKIFTAFSLLASCAVSQRLAPDARKILVNQNGHRSERRFVYKHAAGTSVLGSAFRNSSRTANNASAQPAIVKLSDLVSVKDYGAVGDGITDSSAAIQAAAHATSAQGTMRFSKATYNVSLGFIVPAGITVDLNGATLRINGPISLGTRVTVQNGAITWTNRGGALINSTVRYFDVLKVSDDDSIINVSFLGSGGIGSVGVSLNQSAIRWAGTAYPGFAVSANRVTVRNCYFTNMSTGIFVGGAARDAIPYGWQVIKNRFEGIVGYRGNSEGYGVLYSPASYSIIQGNTFKTIARHAIYLAGGASYNDVSNNDISEVDNVGIQLNNYPQYAAVQHNKIYRNILSHITKSIAYGYSSSVGIGCFQNSLYNVIENNFISDFQDVGIMVVATDSNNRLAGLGNRILQNVIYGTGTALTAGIEIDNPDGYVVQGNQVSVASGYAIAQSVATTGYAPAIPTVIRDNTMAGLGPSVYGLRMQSKSVPNIIANNHYMGIVSARQVLDTGSGNLYDHVASDVDSPKR